MVLSGGKPEEGRRVCHGQLDSFVTKTSSRKSVVGDVNSEQIRLLKHFHTRLLLFVVCDNEIVDSDL